MFFILEGPQENWQLRDLPLRATIHMVAPWKRFT